MVGKLRNVESCYMSAFECYYPRVHIRATSVHRVLLSDKYGQLTVNQRCPVADATVVQANSRVVDAL